MWKAIKQTMQTLERSGLSQLTDNMIKKLFQNRIVTILDFLNENIEKLSAITKLSLSEVITVRNEIFSKFSSPVINGTTLLVQSFVNRKVISTGIESLDEVLDGGIPIGFITEICGLADSGKTQLCFQIAINCVKNSNDTILYIDTKGDFSAVRIQRILEVYRYSHKEMALIMYKIRVVRLWTMDEVVELLENLKNRTLIIENLAVIIIDSMPCIMFQHIGEDNKVGLSHLNTLVNHARFLCKELHVAVICVNILTRWVEQGGADNEDDGEYSTFKENFTEKNNRCLGKYWQHIPALVMVLKKNPSKEGTETYCDVTITITSTNKFESKDGQCIVRISSLGVT